LTPIKEGFGPIQSFGCGDVHGFNNHNRGEKYMSNTENTGQANTSARDWWRMGDLEERSYKIRLASFDSGIQGCYERRFGYDKIEPEKGEVDDDFGMGYAGVLRRAAQERARINKIFDIDWERQVLTLHADATPREIDLDLIQTKADLLECTRHLCEQPWMDSSLLAEFVDRVAFIKRWDELFDRITNRHYRNFYREANRSEPATRPAG
jgi:hypothetical protein